MISFVITCIMGNYNFVIITGSLVNVKISLTPESTCTVTQDDGKMTGQEKTKHQFTVQDVMSILTTLSSHSLCNLHVISEVLKKWFLAQIEVEK